LSTLTTPGIYFDDDITGENKPSTGSYGIVLVLGSSTLKVQIFIGYSAMYYRAYIDGWNQWRTINVTVP
jgi:hypothetical protein